VRFQLIEEVRADLLFDPEQPGKDGRDVFPAHCCGLAFREHSVSATSMMMMMMNRRHVQVRQRLKFGQEMPATSDFSLE
jgi:hypothetical protein